MEVQWFRQDKPAVLDALRRGQRPLMATTMASGPLDELVALHIELGIFDVLDSSPWLGSGTVSPMRCCSGPWRPCRSCPRRA